MKIFRSFRLLILFLFSWSPFLFASSLPQSLTRGESLTLNTEYEIGDVAVTDPGIIDFLLKEDRRSIYLNAIQEGFATLTLWDSEGKLQDTIPITVYGASLEAILNEAKQSFASIQTIRFQIKDGILRIIGEVPTPSDFERIEEFARRHPQVLNEAVMARPVLDTLTSRIEEAIATPGIKVRSVRNRVILEGVAYSQSAALRAFEVAKLYAPNCLNLIEVREQNRILGREKMVQLDLYFMEIQKSALRSFGVEWAPGSFANGEGANVSLGGGQSGAGMEGLGKSLIGFVLNLLPKIRFVREQGLGRVLENPTLFVKSGERGEFFSGVQIPYYAEQTVQFKEAGVKLEVHPIAAGKDVDLQLTATISSPSPHIEGGINTHTVTTSAYIPEGEAVILGGILSNRDVKTTNRVPKNIAVGSALFTLFLSKDFQSSSSELILFVRPRIVDGMTSAVAKKEDWNRMKESILKERSMKEYEEYMEKRFGKKEGRKVLRKRWGE